MRPVNCLKTLAMCSLLTVAGSCGTSSAQYAGDYDLRHDYRPYPAQYAQTTEPSSGQYRYENYNYEDYDRGADQTPPPPTAEDPQIDPSEFREPLAQYGQWQTVPEYGDVWLPANVEPGWRPYTVGHWTYTDYGWTWASYEPFGWATYHYGRWTCLPTGAWAWVPGRVWGPAWVSWRYGEGYCGWAPLPPVHGFAVGVEYWDTPYIPSHYYSFVSAGSFCRPYVNRYFISHDRHAAFYHRTHAYTRITVVDRRVVNCGMDVGYVERHGGSRVERGHVRPVHRPGDKGHGHGTDVAVYRPVPKVPRYPDKDRPSGVRTAAVERPSRDATVSARNSTTAARTERTSPRVEVLRPSRDVQTDRPATGSKSAEVSRPSRDVPSRSVEVVRPSRDLPTARSAAPERRAEVVRPSRDVPSRSVEVVRPSRDVPTPRTAAPERKVEVVRPSREAPTARPATPERKVEVVRPGRDAPAARPTPSRSAEPARPSRDVPAARPAPTPSRSVAAARASRDVPTARPEPSPSRSPQISRPSRDAAPERSAPAPRPSRDSSSSGSRGGDARASRR